MKCLRSHFVNVTYNVRNSLMVVQIHALIGETEANCTRWICGYGISDVECPDETLLLTTKWSVTQPFCIQDKLHGKPGGDRNDKAEISNKPMFSSSVISHCFAIFHTVSQSIKLFRTISHLVGWVRNSLFRTPIRTSRCLPASVLKSPILFRTFTFSEVFRNISHHFALVFRTISHFGLSDLRMATRADKREAASPSFVHLCR